MGPEPEPVEEAAAMEPDHNRFFRGGIERRSKDVEHQAIFALGGAVIAAPSSVPGSLGRGWSPRYRIPDSSPGSGLHGRHKPVFSLSVCAVWDAFKDFDIASRGTPKIARGDLRNDRGVLLRTRKTAERRGVTCGQKNGTVPEKSPASDWKRHRESL
jgi:hypothetical protein